MSNDDWVKLQDYPSENLPRGLRLLVKGSAAYETVVELFLAEDPDSASGFQVIVMTGHKSGVLLVKLPQEAGAADSVAISKKWMVDNWNKWIDAKSSVSEVLCKRRYAIHST